MPELKLGNKHECFNCGTKFYDLGKNEPLCPKCGANQKDASQAESPALSQAARRRRKAEVARPPIDAEEDEAPIDIAADEEIEPGDLGPDLGDDEDEEEEIDDEH